MKVIKIKQPWATLIAGGIQDRTWNGYGFKLENIKKVSPINISGKLGFWNYEGDIFVQK